MIAFRLQLPKSLLAESTNTTARITWSWWRLGVGPALAFGQVLVELDEQCLAQGRIIIDGIEHTGIELQHDVLAAAAGATVHAQLPGAGRVSKLQSARADTESAQQSGEGVSRPCALLERILIDLSHGHRVIIGWRRHCVDDALPSLSLS